MADEPESWPGALGLIFGRPPFEFRDPATRRASPDTVPRWLQPVRPGNRDSCDSRGSVPDRLDQLNVDCSIVWRLTASTVTNA